MSRVELNGQGPLINGSEVGGRRAVSRRDYALRRGILFYSSVVLVAGVLTVMVVKGHVELSAPGVVTGEEVRISAAQAGRIARLHRGVHDAFRAGDLIASLHNEDLESLAQALRSEIESLNSLITEIETRPTADPAKDLVRDLENYRLELGKAQGQLRVAEMAILHASTTVDIKKDAVERSERLVAQSAQLSSELQTRKDELRLAELDLRRAKLERDVEQTRIHELEATIQRTVQAIADARVAIPDTASSIRARLAEKKTELLDAEAKIAGLEIRAPYDGIVVHCLKHEGELAAQGETIFLTVVGDKRWIRVQVDPEDAEHLAPEMSVEIITGMNSSRENTGRIRSISPLVEAEASSSMMGFMPPRRSTLVLVMPNGRRWEGLVPGQEVTCRIAIDRSYVSWLWQIGESSFGGPGDRSQSTQRTEPSSQTAVSSGDAAPDTTQ